MLSTQRHVAERATLRSMALVAASDGTPAANCGRSLVRSSPSTTRAARTCSCSSRSTPLASSIRRWRAPRRATFPTRCTPVSPVGSRQMSLRRRCRRSVRSVDPREHRAELGPSRPRRQSDAGTGIRGPRLRDRPRRALSWWVGSAREPVARAAFREDRDEGLNSCAGTPTFQFGAAPSPRRVPSVRAASPPGARWSDARSCRPRGRRARTDCRSLALVLPLSISTRRSGRGRDGFAPSQPRVHRTFVHESGIQHPGEQPGSGPGNPANPKQFSSWPDGPTGGRPRSSCIVITKNDGGKIGT